MPENAMFSGIYVFVRKMYFRLIEILGETLIDNIVNLP